MPFTSATTRNGLRAVVLATAVFGLELAPAASAWAGAITFNTALPVSAGEIIVRGQSRVVRGSAGAMDQQLTGVGGITVLAYGLTPRVTLFATLPLFVHKSLNLTTPMGRISRGTNGFGDSLFLGRYTLLEVNRRGSTLRIAPFFGLWTPTGSDQRSDRFGAIARPLQPGSGSWDPQLGGVLTYQSLKWEFDTSSGYRFNTAADHFSFGDEAFTNQSFQYRVWPSELGSGVPGFLYAVLESNLIWTGKNRMNGKIDPNSGGLIWYLDPGLQWVTERYVLEAAVQLPAVTSFNGAGLGKNGLGNDFQVIAGFRVNLFSPFYF